MRLTIMSQPEKNIVEADTTRRNIFIGIALVSALLVAGVVYLVTRPSSQGVEPRLENALRTGSPEFDQYRERIVIDFDPDENATRGVRALGDLVVNMKPTIRNFTGRTISGLELHAAAVDLEGKVMKERTVIAIPRSGAAELAPNKTLNVPIMLEGMSKDILPANLRIELTGVRFKQ
ncbi:MAG: hypothetical protein M3430_04880 [Acidobacteriota bacterium]|nr:hypothetical protein [Acidobacteriota bacterium]